MSRGGVWGDVIITRALSTSSELHSPQSHGRPGPMVVRVVVRELPHFRTRQWSPEEVAFLG